MGSLGMGSERVVEEHDFQADCSNEVLSSFQRQLVLKYVQSKQDYEIYHVSIFTAEPFSQKLQAVENRKMTENPTNQTAQRPQIGEALKPICLLTLRYTS